MGICGAGGEIIARVNLQFPTFAVHFIASHPSAQNALGWGTPRCEWRTQDKKTSVGRPPGYTTIPLARVCVFQSRNVGGFQPAPKGSVMTKFEVLSINPKTKSPELMPCETLEQAQSQRRIAIGLGRLLVEIVDSHAAHESWQAKAREEIRQLQGT